MDETITETRYRVTFGPREEHLRESRTFDLGNEAATFFRKKEQAGLHVDVYEITTTVRTTKLTA